MHGKQPALLRCKESEDTLNSFTSPTGYEPKLLAFEELYDSSVPFSFMIPSSDQDVDDVTLGEMLTAAHRGQLEYCVPGGMSVSQSSSVMFDGSGQLDGEKTVDRSWQLDVTRNVIEAHSTFSEDTRIEHTHDRSGKLDERNSSNAQIRTTVEIPTLPVDQCHSHLIQYLKDVETFFHYAEPQRRAAKHLGHTWYIGKRFCKSRCVFISSLSSKIASMEFVNRRAAPFVHSGERHEQDQDLRCQSGPSAKDSVIFNGGDSSKNYGADQQRLQILDLHFDKFLTPATFACWKMRF